MCNFNFAMSRFSFFFSCLVKGLRVWRGSIPGMDERLIIVPMQAMFFLPNTIDVSLGSRVYISQERMNYLVDIWQICLYNRQRYISLSLVITVLLILIVGEIIVSLMSQGLRGCSQIMWAKNGGSSSPPHPLVRKNQKLANHPSPLSEIICWRTPINLVKPIFQEEI